MFTSLHRASLAGCAAFLLTLSNASASTLNVPSVYPTVQAAIDAAVDGDTVLIAPGTYLETIDFNGKSITVKGSGQFATSLVGNGNGRIVRMVNVGTGARLESMAIREGSDSTGGGIRVEGPATIKSCSIRDCEATTFGGGIWASGGATIESCGISFNFASNGGGLRIAGDCTVIDCNFVGNLALNNGGAIHADGDVHIEGIYTEDNGADRGTALWLTGGPIDIRRSLVLHGLGAAPVGSTLIESDCSLTMSNTYVLRGQRGLVINPGAATITTQLVNCTFAESMLSAVQMPTPSLAINLLVRNSILHSEADGLDAPPLIGVSVSYSNVTGGWAGIGNIETDHIFKPGALWDLDPTSPCCDAGKNLFAQPFGSLDESGRPRFVANPLVVDSGFPAEAIVDMGAEERQAEVRFVRQSATGANTGLSWTDAYTDLQDGLDEANELALTAVGDVVVMVAEGNYRPDRGTDDRNASFTLTRSVTLVGGFAGIDETEMDERDPAAHPTTLGGAIGGAGTEDNSFHVVRVSNSDTVDPASLIGFTIQRGNANGAPAALKHRGGGILIDEGDVLIRECVFRQNEADNSGGAVMIEGSGSDVVIHRCRLYGNISRGTGSAISSIPSIGGTLLCGATLIHGNDSVDRAAVFLDGTVEASISSSTIADNTSSAGNTGGVLVQSGASLAIDSSIVWKNLGTAGTLENQNLRVLGVVDIDGTTVQGWSGGLGGTLNDGGNPKFVLPFGSDRTRGTADDDYRLQETSPSIDSAFVGIELAWPGDLDGNERPLDDPNSPNTGGGLTVYQDRGCYELQPPPCAADLDGSGTVDAADLAILLGAWGGPGLPDLDGNSVVDAADLAVLLGAWGPC